MDARHAKAAPVRDSVSTYSGYEEHVILRDTFQKHGGEGDGEVNVSTVRSEATNLFSFGQPLETRYIPTSDTSFKPDKDKISMSGQFSARDLRPLSLT